MEKIKAIHLHTDYKFVRNTQFFKGKFFENTNIIIEGEEPYKGPVKGKTFFFSIKDINKITNCCKKFDLVVLYDLGLLKSIVALKLPQTVKIAWRFFGYELYKKRTDLFLSKKTFELSKSFPKSFWRNTLRKIYYIIKYGNTSLKLFYSAINRIDYMLVLSEEEYNFISQHWDNLPEFIKLPHFEAKKELELHDFEVKSNNKKRKVVIGNNRSMFNNHLDVIEIVDESPNKICYEFVLLFNYGHEGMYAEAVRKAAYKKEYYNLIEDFIPPDEFQLFYRQISALVINGYRQMAGANIFSGIRNGTKIYLNEKNVFFTWLINEGFQIFTTEDFKKDLNNDNLFLDRKIAQQNLDQLIKFSDKYTVQDFQKKLYSKIHE